MSSSLLTIASLDSFIVSLSCLVCLIFSPVFVCPLTIWENRLRKKLGWEKIGTFFKHYYIFQPEWMATIPQPKFLYSDL